MNINLNENLALDLNIGLLVVKESFQVEFYSDSVKDWFGLTIKKNSLLPENFRSAETVHIITNDGSKYISFNLKINSGIESYQLYIIFKFQYFVKHFPQTVLYGIYFDELKSILDCVTDGIYITDGKGYTLMLNKAAEKSWSIPAKDLIGKSMVELYRTIYKDLSLDEIEQNSVCLRVIKNKKEVNMIQSGRNDQFKILVTGTPYFENGNISKVISTERNLTELIDLRKQLEQNMEITSKYEAELEYYRSLYLKEHNIIVKDEKMVALMQLAHRIASQDTTVLLQGESGVGKEIFARFIHNHSSRKGKPFIDINCAAIPENLLESELFGYEKGAFTGASSTGKIGMFELANQGTLFLDEINELPIHLQSKILRAVQERRILRIGGTTTIPIDIRIISASNIDLKEAVNQKQFREDLYYRLNVIKILIPALRNRKEDIHVLVQHFLQLHNSNKTHTKISSDALNLLSRYVWPGNVRELSNVIEAAYATCIGDVITSEQLIEIFPELKNTQEEPSKDEHASLKTALERYEKELLISKVPLYKSAQSLADALQIDKSTLIRKMHRYGIINTYVSKGHSLL